MVLVQCAWWRSDDLALEIPYRPAKASDLPNDKGAHREIESEGQVIAPRKQPSISTTNLINL
jgi:hypothetical protein